MTLTNSIREIFKNEDWDFLHPQTRSPRTPPPSCPILREKKLTPYFFLEIESMIAKTNFTLGPIEKSIFRHARVSSTYPCMSVRP